MLSPLTCCIFSWFLFNRWKCASLLLLIRHKVDEGRTGPHRTVVNISCISTTNCALDIITYVYVFRVCHHSYRDPILIHKPTGTICRNMLSETMYLYIYIWAQSDQTRQVDYRLMVNNSRYGQNHHDSKYESIECSERDKWRLIWSFVGLSTCTTWADKVLLLCGTLGTSIIRNNILTPGPQSRWRKMDMGIKDTAYKAHLLRWDTNSVK